MPSQKAEKPTSQSIKSMISNFYPRPIPAILFWRPAKNLYESQAWPSPWYWQIFKILEITSYQSTLGVINQEIAGRRSTCRRWYYHA